MNTYTITIDGVLASIDPPCAELLRSLLTYSETVCRPGGPLGYRFGRHQLRLFDYDATGHLIIPAGLVPRVQAALESASRHVVVQDVTTPDQRLLPDRQLLASAQDEDKNYLEALTGSDRGQVLYHAAWQLGQLLLLARAPTPRLALSL